MREHVPQLLPEAQKKAPEVDPYDPVPVGDATVRDRRNFTVDAGSVERRIDSPEAGDDLGHGALNSGIVRNVALEKTAVAD